MQLYMEPFPHCVMDNFFGSALNLELSVDCANYPLADLIKYDNDMEKKYVDNRVHSLPESVRFAIDVMYTPYRKAKFAKLFGFSKLLDDLPHLYGGGLNISTEGQHLLVHNDFMYHPKVPSLNHVLTGVYFIDSCPTCDLEFWYGTYDRLKSKVKGIECVADRLVLFMNTHTSYHGHPEKVPPNTVRKSLVINYFATNEMLLGRARFLNRPGLDNIPIETLQQRVQIDSKR